MLAGKTIAITRSPEDSAEFISLAKQSNATPIALPTIQLVSKGQQIVDEFLESVSSYNPDYSVFMSSKAVKLLFDTAKKVNKIDGLKLAVANTIVVSVGPKTTLALESEGIKVNHQPTTFSSVGVGEVFTRIHAVGKRAIIPRSGASTPFLKELLSKIGVDVMEIHLYDVCAFSGEAAQWNVFRELFSADRVDGIIFTSASSVRGFFEILSADYGGVDGSGNPSDTLLQRLDRSYIVSIGPFTSDELKRFKVRNTVAQVHTVPGAFDAMNNAFL